nr:POTRA domain-containing protein [Hankyongella ginsenosidimutans]
MIHGIATRSRSLPCSSRRLTRVLAALAVGCCLPAVDAYAQQAGPQVPAPQNPAPSVQEQSAAPAQSLGVIRSILVTGNERLEPETVRSYIDLRVGAQYDREALDIALKKLYGTDLFADVTIRDDSGF